ncbi:uncharacterized protein [Haliotis cracherodii]|uniref:uncharacterized protein n=1 Tax=Haliotis cracherodii TaxID=6455 RepID=UPI0039E88302
MKMRGVIVFVGLCLVSMATSETMPLILNLDLYAQIMYNVVDDGCRVNGALKSFDSEFTLDLTGSCVKYRCTNDGVSIITDQSGCKGDSGCVTGLTAYGCNAYKCPQEDTTMNGKPKVWLIDTDAEEQCEIFGVPQCYDLYEWHTVNGMRCKCDSRSEMNCEFGAGPPDS